MTIKNGDLPAMPVHQVWQDCGADGNSGPQFVETIKYGLTKRETFCLHMGVADTGDAELDAIIRKGNRQKMAIAAMHSFMAAPMGKFDHKNAEDALRDAIVISGELLAELERAK